MHKARLMQKVQCSIKDNSLQLWTILIAFVFLLAPMYTVMHFLFLSYSFKLKSRNNYTTNLFANVMHVECIVKCAKLRNFKILFYLMFSNFVVLSPWGFNRSFFKPFDEVTVRWEWAEFLCWIDFSFFMLPDEVEIIW